MKVSYEQLKTISKYAEIVDLQVKSHEQTLQETDEVRINEITIGKGGSSALIYASFLVKMTSSLINLFMKQKD